MVGLKRTASDASCDGDCHAEESSPRKQLRPAPEDWCMWCGGPAEDLCVDDDHVVVDIHISEANVLSRFADIRDLVVSTQGRLDVMLDARLRHGPVLEAAVEGVDKEGWRVPGGDISITMAAVPANLSAEEKDAVCAALSGVRLDYKMKGTECAVGFGDVAVDALQTVLPRLPACAEGQTVQRGAVLLHGSQLLVFFRKTRLDGRGDAAKLFGYLSKSSQDALEGRAEDRLTQVVPVGFSGVKFAK